MLFLLGRKTHPVVGLALGVIVLVIGLVLHANLLAASGALYMVFAGYRAVRRLRGGQVRDGQAHADGPAR